MDQTPTVVRLAKPRKKGLWRLVFSRFFIIVLLLLVQVFLVVALNYWLTEQIPIFVAVQTVFTLAMVVYLFNNDMDSAAKLTWMFIIAILPLPGAMLLAFTQTDLGHRAVKAGAENQIARTRGTLPKDRRVLHALKHEGSGTDDLCTYLNRSGCFPLYGDTAVTYFPSGEEKFAALLEDLEKAESYIYLEYFIIEEGYMWGRMLDVLTRKVQAGVDVRVMYDGMCEMSNLPSNYCQLLAAHGIRAKAFAPIRPVVSSHYNYRDHRKILVIDGRIAYNGGVNLADEYINRIERFGHWKDVAVRLSGTAAQSFTLMFLQMWNLDEREPDYSVLNSLAPVPDPDATGYVLPYGDCPLDGDKVGETVYMDILNRATDYVHIMTPYLILDGELETALKYAAERGVDVKLILPGIPDKKMAYSLAKSHYHALVNAGVKIYEYTPGFVHAKVFVCDDKKAVVGTINLDYRSLYHHFECATYLYQCSCIPDIERDFQATLEKCRAVTPETIRAEKLGYKLWGHLLKFLAPLM